MFKLIGKFCELEFDSFSFLSNTSNELDSDSLCNTFGILTLKVVLATLPEVSLVLSSLILLESFCEAKNFYQSLFLWSHHLNKQN